MIKINLSDVFVSLLWFPNLTDSAQLWELRVCAAPPRLWAGCARSTIGTLVLSSELLSLWNVLWMGITDGSSYPSTLFMQLALLQTGNERENAGEGGLPKDTMTLQWDWLLPVYLLFAAGFPNPSVSGSTLLVCLPAPTQHCSEDGYPSQEPPSRSLFHHPQKLEPGCPHWAMPSTCYCDTSEASLPCSGAQVDTDAHRARSRLCEGCVWIFLQATVK